MKHWKEIEIRGYKLRVSSDGEVHLPEKKTTFSAIRLGKSYKQTSVFKERTLKPSMTHMGYLEVAFVHKRKRFRFLVHRLVAMAFVKGFKGGMVVNHLDGNKLNNAPSNLEWVTPSRNSQHAWEAKLIPLRGSENPTAKLTEKRVLYIRKLLAKGIAANTIAIVAGLSPATIDNIKNRKSWVHV